jgi:hypothetical protein
VSLVSLVEQELLTLPEHLSSPPVFTMSGVILYDCCVGSSCVCVIDELTVILFQNSIYAVYDAVRKTQRNVREFIILYHNTLHCYGYEKGLKIPKG